MDNGETLGSRSSQSDYSSSGSWSLRTDSCSRSCHFGSGQKVGHFIGQDKWRERLPSKGDFNSQCQNK